MSLLNVKHLVTPFQNWVHLILIVLMAFLFAAYRWAGGRVEFRSPSDVPAIQVGSSERTAPARVPVGDSATRARPSEERDLLKEFQANNDTAQKKAGTDDQNGTLSDLERQLGLK